VNGALLRDTRLGTCYRTRIESLLELIDVFDHEVLFFSDAIAARLGITVATEPFNGFPAWAPRSPRSLSSRSATSVVSPAPRSCARGPG
jgi:hypothetical protein